MFDRNRRVLLERVGKEDLTRVTIFRRYARDSWSEIKVDFMRDRHIPTRLRLMQPCEIIDKREAF